MGSFFHLNIIQNVNEDDFIEYIDRSDFKVNMIKREGNAIDIIKNESEKMDLLIMGDMKYMFMYERIAGKFGLKILEKIQIPIFIG